ncbi:MAG: sulfur carrier protein ThiS [Cystobacterineae bacterium]|nr:sulfur carrier protein ThiS [Cystobacterineae bacterium]
MEILLNGEKRTLEAPMSVAALLVQLGLEGQPVAVERNGQLVRRQQHANTQLCEGDRLEVVSFVGGG